jgi:hypothetical protein
VARGTIASQVGVDAAPTFHLPKENSMSEVITKRRVTMQSFVAVSATEVHTYTAVDYVRPDFLDAYVADAKTRWQSVEVSEEPDAGPGGYHGETVIPANLEHPLAGVVFAATTPEGN